ncbi:hypothetical protein RFI_07906 [Reticulomyxa filosa]|uniref:Dynein heavy chain coiled coil stalk domain-containing protein n=1 Tax=Reticulomyxa filosa TaxID=46433 RepID=X6NSF0_RETFI|nr:hypothetical protein RFI_07906 [Reticulomyxa filosa]|eukprot:ETO29220.1 hypothetical protein RFI_07906 [Reticulomyxa filosa]
MSPEFIFGTKSVGAPSPPEKRTGKPRSQSFLIHRPEFSAKGLPLSKTPKPDRKPRYSMLSFQESSENIKTRPIKSTPAKAESQEIVELSLNDISKLQELREIFKEAAANKKFYTVEANTNKSLLIDKHGLLCRIRQIGLATGKRLEELQNEQNLAMEKMKEILEFETNAKSQHKKALELQIEVDKEIQIIQEKQAVVDAELAKAQPAICEAKNASAYTYFARPTHSIKRTQIYTYIQKKKKKAKTDWNELRAYKNPKDVLKTVMTVAVALVKNDSKILCLGTKDKKSTHPPGQDDHWAEIKREINYDLVKKLMSFLDSNAAEDLDPKVVTLIKEILENITYEQAVNASKVAGPVFLWIKSVLFYSELLVEIVPLKDHIWELKERWKDKKDEMALLKSQEIEFADKIQKCRGEMLEMTGYKQSGGYYFL